MLPKRKIGFGYIVGKLITSICSVWNQCNYFSKKVRKVFKSGICLLIAPVLVHCLSITFIRLRSKGPLIWKINIKILIEKHVRMFLTSGDSFFQIICQIFCTCVWDNFELVLID